VLAITNTDSKASKRLFIFLTPPKVLLSDFRIPRICGDMFCQQTMLAMSASPP